MPQAPRADAGRLDECGAAARKEPSALGAEAGAHFVHEHLRAFQGGEVPAAVQLVPVDQVRVVALGPAPGGCLLYTSDAADE